MSYLLGKKIKLMYHQPYSTIDKQLNVTRGFGDVLTGILAGADFSCF